MENPESDLERRLADLDAPIDEAFELVVDIAAGRVDDHSSIARRLSVWRRLPA